MNREDVAIDVTIQDVEILRNRVAELETVAQQVGDLLAVIHRDGGHYQDEHGIAKAIIDAKEVVNQDRIDLNEWQHAAETADSGAKKLADYAVQLEGKIASKHPEQAGGDERDFQAEGAQEVPSPVSQEYDRHLISLLRKGEALPGHQEEAADEIERLRDWNDHLNNTVLPNILNPNFLMLMKGGERLLDLCTKDGKFIGVSLNDMKDVFDWMVTHARIASDHAALAQPSPKCATCNDRGHVCLDWEAGAWEECPDCAQAEAERPEMSSERAAYFMRRFKSEEKLLGPNEQAAVDYVLSLIAQHERIVGALRFERQQMDRAFTACINERDAALARVAKLESKLAELEMQAPVAFLYRGTDMGDQLTLIRLDHYWRPKYSTEEHDYIKGIPLYAAPVAQAQQLHDLDKQCRDDVARALGLRPSQGRGFAWSYLLASIKSCVKAAEDTAQAQHSVPVVTPEMVMAAMAVFRLDVSPFKSMEAALIAALRKAAAPGKEVGHE